MSDNRSSDAWMDENQDGESIGDGERAIIIAIIGGSERRKAQNNIRRSSSSF